MFHLPKTIELPEDSKQLAYWSEAAENIPEDEVQLVLKSTGLTQAQQNALSYIKSFLYQAIDASRNGESRILVLRGEWGLGKTLLSKVIKDKLVREISIEKGVNIVYKELNLGNILSNVINECREAYDAERCFSEVLLRPAKALILQHNTIVVLFIDEFEWLIWHKSGRVGDKEIIELMEAFIKIFRDKKSYIGMKYGGKVHIIFASTPSAYQIFISSLREKEFHGWLERRIDTIDLHPAMKHEVMKIIDTLIRELLGIEPNSLFRDARLKELIYTLSQGNLGSVITVFNKVIYYSIMKCVEKNGRNCIYQINEELLAESLINTALSTPIGKENPLDKVVFSQLLIEARKGNRVDFLLRMLFTSSSVLLQRDYGNLNGELLKYSLERYGVKLLKCKCFVVGNQDELLRNIEDLTDIIANDYTNQYEKYIVKLSLSNIIHLLDDNYYVISIPNDAESLAGLLSFYEPMGVSTDTFQQIISTLQKNSRKVIEGIVLAPEEYVKLYPVITPSTIPFIRKRSDAKIAYIEAREEMSNNIERFEMDLESAVKDLMLTLKLAEYDRKTNGMNIVVREGPEVVKAPLDVKVFIKKVVGNAEKFKELCKETRLCVLVCPENVELDILTKIFEDWNRVIVPMKLRDIYYLVASIIARRNKLSIREDELKKYYHVIAKKYKLDSLGYSWKHKGLEMGVIVPRELLNMYSLPSKEKNPLAVFRDGYRTLLLGGDSFTLEELISKIIRIYRAIPYHERDGKFCGVNVPSYIKVDLEPEGTAGTLLKANVMKRAKDYLQSILDVAMTNGMAKYLNTNAVTQIQLTLHPIEKRVINIVSNECRRQNTSGISLHLLRDKFIFTTDEHASSRVFSTLLKILESRGYIIIEGGKIKCIDIEKYVYESYDKIATKLNEFRRIIGEIQYLLEEGGLSPATLENAMLHIAVSKEKGWKLILLKDVNELVQEFVNSIDYTQRSLGLRNLRFADETLSYAINLVDKIMMRAVKYIITIRRNIRDTKNRIEQIKDEISNIVESYTYMKPIYIALKKHMDYIEYEINRIAEAYSECITRNIDPDSILKLGKNYLNKRDKREELKPYFHYKDGCCGTHEITVYFNLILYKLYNDVEKKLREYLQKDINYLENIKKELNSIVRAVDITSKSLNIATKEVEKYIEKVIAHEAEVLRHYTSIETFYEGVKRCREQVISELNLFKNREKEIRDKERLLKKAENSLKDIEVKYMKFINTISKISEELSHTLGSFLEKIPGLKGYLDSFNKFANELHNENEESIDNLRRKIIRGPTLPELKDIVNYDIPNLCKRYNNYIKKASDILRDISEILLKTIQNSCEASNNLIKRLGEKVPEDIVINRLVPLRLRLLEKEERIRDLLSLMENILKDDNIKYPFNELRQELTEFFSITREIRNILFRNSGLEKDAELIFAALKELIEIPAVKSTEISEITRQLAKRTNLSEEKVLDILYTLAKVGLITIKVEIHL